MILFNLAAHFHNSLHTLQTSLHNLQTRFKLLYTLPDLAAPSQTSLHTPQHRFILSNLAANPKTSLHIPTPRFIPAVQLSKLYKIIKANVPHPHKRDSSIVVRSSMVCFVRMSFGLQQPFTHVCQRTNAIRTIEILFTNVLP